jgi:hypothetical protein
VGAAVFGGDSRAGTSERARLDAERSGTAKPPENGNTGDEPMTGARSSYLHALGRETGEAMDRAARGSMS